MQLLSGNGGEGGTLIENRSDNMVHDYPSYGGESISGAGIVLKAAKSQVATLSSELYLRTGGEKELKNGQIIIDAGRAGDIRMIARSQYRFSEVQYVDNFGIETIRACNVFSEYATLLQGSLFAGSGLYTNGPVIAGAGVTTAAGHFSSPQGGDVGKLLSPSEIQSGLDSQQSSLNAVTQGSQAIYDKLADSIYSEMGGIGNEEMIHKISVGMRDEQEYGTSGDFIWPQCYWQQMVGDDSNVEDWYEPVVKYQQSAEEQESGTDTMPWPGNKAWTDEKTLTKTPLTALTMFDMEKGVGKSRDVFDDASGYAKAEIPLADRVVPQYEYKVIKVKR
jgi:hypothetical protein